MTLLPLHLRLLRGRPCQKAEEAGNAAAVAHAGEQCPFLG